MLPRSKRHFIYAADARVREDVVLSALGVRCIAGVSLLNRRSLNANFNLVFAGDGSRLAVADVAMKSFSFRVVTVYAPNTIGVRRAVFRRLEPFLGNSKRIVLVGD